MKAILGIVGVLVAVGLLMVLVRGAKSERPRDPARKGQAPPNVIAELRYKVLLADPKDLGLAPSKKRPNVWGVVLEIGFPDASATLFSAEEVGQQSHGSYGLRTSCSGHRTWQPLCYK